MGPVLAPVAEDCETSAEQRSASVGGAAGDRSQRLALVVLGAALLVACLVVLLRGRGQRLDPAAGAPHGASTQERPEGAPFQVNVNEADWAVLCLVPGLGETLSKRIVAYREAKRRTTPVDGAEWPIDSLDELLKVDGIGRIKLREMKPFLTLGGATGGGTDDAPAAPDAEPAGAAPPSPVGQRQRHAGVQAGQ